MYYFINLGLVLFWLYYLYAVNADIFRVWFDIHTEQVLHLFKNS